MLAKYETPPTWQESRSHDIRLVSMQEHLQAWLALESCKERVSGFHGIGKVKGRYAQQEREIELPRYATLRREGQILGCSLSPPSPFLLLGFLLRAKPGRLDGRGRPAGRPPIAHDYRQNLVPSSTAGLPGGDSREGRTIADDGVRHSR